MNNTRVSPIRILNPEKLVYSPHMYGPGTIGATILWMSFKDEANILCDCRLDSSVSGELCKGTGEEMNLPLLRNSSSDMCKSIPPIADTPYPQNMQALWNFLFGFRGEDQTILVGEWGGTYVNPAV